MGRRATGKGATVRKERTSARGNPGGYVNPTRSKVKRGTAGPATCPQVDRSDGWPSAGPPDR